MVSTGVIVRRTPREVLADRIVGAIAAGLALYVIILVIETRWGIGGIGLIAQALLAGVAGGSVAITVAWFPRLLQVNLWVLVALITPAAWQVLRDFYDGQIAFRGVIFIFVITAIAACRPRLRALKPLAWILVLTAVAALILGILFPTLGITQVDTHGSARSDKELIPGLGMLRGFYTQENNLGQVLSLGFPLVLLFRTTRGRITAGTLVALGCIWSSSRGSLIALVIALALMVVLPKLEGRQIRMWVSRSALIVLGAMVMYLPFVLRPDDEGFTGRGKIWSNSTDTWMTQNPFFGLGSDWFATMQQNSASTIFDMVTHGHNQAVQLGVTGGILALVLFYVSIAAVAIPGTARSARDDVFVTAYLAAVFVSSWLEMTVGYVDAQMFWPWTLPIMAVIAFRRDRVEPQATRLRPARQFATGTSTT